MTVMKVIIKDVTLALIILALKIYESLLVNTGT